MNKIMFQGFILNLYNGDELSYALMNFFRKSFRAPLRS